MGTATLIQNTAGEVVTYIETIGGVPYTDLDASDVTVDIKKSDSSGFINIPLTDTTNATAAIGSGTNGVISVEVPGTAGNVYTIEVVAPVAGTNSLTVSLLGTAITVTLAITAGVLETSANTATLVAAAIDAAVGPAFGVASGTGEDSLTTSEGPTPLTGGIDGDFTDLGSGFYGIALSALYTDVLGSTYLRVSSPLARPSLEVVYITTSVASTPATITAPDITTLTGTILDQDGTARANVAVSALTLSTPSIIGGVGVTTSLITEKTDSDGTFTLSLLTGSQVDIIIPAMNYRRTLTVPTTSQNLFEIP